MTSKILEGESANYVHTLKLVPPERIELSTPPLPRVCSTTEPRRQPYTRNHGIGIIGIQDDFTDRPNYYLLIWFLNKLFKKKRRSIQNIIERIKKPMIKGKASINPVNKRGENETLEEAGCPCFCHTHFIPCPGCCASMLLFDFAKKQ